MYTDGKPRRGSQTSNACSRIHLVLTTGGPLLKTEENLLSCGSNLLKLVPTYHGHQTVILLSTLSPTKQFTGEKFDIILGSLVFQYGV